MPDESRSGTDVGDVTESEAGELLAAFRESHASAVFDPERATETEQKGAEPKDAEPKAAEPKRAAPKDSEPIEKRGT